MSVKESIKSLSHNTLSERLASLGLPKFRVGQIEKWLWQKGVSSFDEMTNLSKEVRNQLGELFTIEIGYITLKQLSKDGTRKYLITFSDNTSVEAVGIPSKSFKHLTVCFSTQAGCAMNCSFCATGKAGFKRNLTIGEMVDQIRLVGDDFGLRVSNIVAMGQGEPFLNYDAVIEALRIFNNEKIGFGIGARHITVSTCGIFDGIRRLSQEPEQFTLAVSLHSAIQETRDSLMPGVKNMTVEALKNELSRYATVTNRRPTLEYALIANVNDSDEHLNALIDFCSNMLIHVNLIPLNPISNEQEEAGMLRPSSKLDYFQYSLADAGIEASIRISRGSDIDGACGQLRQRVL